MQIRCEKKVPFWKVNFEKDAYVRLWKPVGVEVFWQVHLLIVSGDKRIIFRNVNDDTNGINFVYISSIWGYFCEVILSI